MNVIFRLLIVLLSSMPISGNSQEEYEYLGVIKLDDTLMISYKLEFKEQNGKIDGYSLTDLGGEHETRSEIKGTYDQLTKTLHFNEYGIVYTKSPITQADFCFINFRSNSFSLSKNRPIQGDFKGLFSDGTECINGNLVLKNIEKINKQVKKITKKINRTNRIEDSIKARINPIKFMDTLSMNILRENQMMSVFSKSNSVNLIIFDGGKEDDDIITIKLNGKVILSNYKIGFKQKVLPITLDNEKTIVSIIANSVGTISTNTAVIEIKNDDLDIRALTNLKRGEITSITFLRTNN